MQTVSEYIQRLHKREIPNLVTASHTQGPRVLIFLRVCPPQRFRLGFHVQVQQLLDEVIHHADQFLFVIAE